MNKIAKLIGIGFTAVLSIVFAVITKVALPALIIMVLCKIFLKSFALSWAWTILIPVISFAVSFVGLIIIRVIAGLKE